MSFRLATIRSLGLVFILVSVPALASDRTGFFLPDTISEVHVGYREVNGLIVLPFVINDSILVNLILDTGASNIILFGKRFTGLIDQSARPIRFSGHGLGKQSTGFAMIGSRFRLNSIRGENIPVVVIPGRQFPGCRGVDGVIGLDILQKFEVEIDPVAKFVSFRSAMQAPQRPGYKLVELELDGHRPIVRSAVTWFGKTDSVQLLIDTGSMFGLIMFTNNNLSLYANETKIMGSGLDGKIPGLRSSVENFDCKAFELDNVPIEVVVAKRKPYVSIGMEILKNYKMIVNYSMGYVGFHEVP